MIKWIYGTSTCFVEGWESGPLNTPEAAKAFESHCLACFQKYLDANNISYRVVINGRIQIGNELDKFLLLARL